MSHSPLSYLTPGERARFGLPPTTDGGPPTQNDEAPAAGTDEASGEPTRKNHATPKVAETSVDIRPIAVASIDTALAFTVVTNRKGALTKEYSVDAAGLLAKKTRAIVSEGTVETAAVQTLEHFGEYLSTLKANQALAYGITGRHFAELVTKEALPRNPGKVARDREHFHYRTGPGIWMLDHDAGHLAQAYGRDDLRRAVVDAVPAMGMVPMLWTPSSSSFIYDGDGTELQGLRGQRLYIPVADASDITRAGRVLYERLWAAGIGAYAVSGAGTLLDRNLVDASTWQPERLDFVAGAKCMPPLQQRRPTPHVWEADIVGGTDPALTRELLLDLTTTQREAAAAHRAAAKASAEPQRLAARDHYVTAQGDDLAQRTGLAIDQARRIVAESIDRHLLFAEFLLYPDEGEPVSVGEVLDNPGRWHGRRFADPVEVDYRGDRRVSWVNLRSGGRPYLYSHAHGGRRFELVRQPAVLRVQVGEAPRLADDCLAVMREHGEVFDFGPQQMARVAAGRVFPVSPGWLLDYLGRVIRFERFDKRTKDWEPTDTPEKVAKAIVERSGERKLPLLRAVITAPTLRADGTVLDTPGHDVASGLLYVSEEPTPPRVPEAPSKGAVLEALRELFEPFAGFPFDGPESRGTMLAALLSAVVRRSLPTAPAFAFDAPAAGTGKTLAARCVAALGGHDGASFTPPGSDEETRKVLFSALREGAGCVIFDNLVQPLGGAPINQFLTEPQFSGRILGVSENTTLPNAALFLVTANNFRAYADTCRRVLVCRLDAGVEQPYRRRFDFDPLQFVRDRRHRLTVCALTLIRGFIAAGAPQSDSPLGSFEQWDALVRQTVCWLAGLQDEIVLADPARTIDASAENDEHRSTLSAVLAAWAEAFGKEGATAAHALLYAQGAVAHSPATPEEFADTSVPGKEHIRPTTDGLEAERQGGLRDALDGLEAERSGRLSPKRLGRWLLTHKGEIAAGRKFVQVANRDGVSVWRTEPA